jgi:hypothetical protein
MRKGVAGLKASMSDTGEDSALSEVDGSDAEKKLADSSGPNASGVRSGAGQVKGISSKDGTDDVEMGGMEEEEEDGGDGDDRKYCTCRSVSYGNMVACDNDDCEYEWFHWSCVGMTREPAGKWYCEECRAKLGLK